MDQNLHKKILEIKKIHNWRQFSRQHFPEGIFPKTVIPTS